jgi:hypothetical protein
LGKPVNSNKFRPVHGRECLGDGLDRVQDPQIKAATTSVERTLGTTGGTKLRNVIFIIIESGMALLAVQLVRVVFTYLRVGPGPVPSPVGFNIAYEIYSLLSTKCLM